MALVLIENNPKIIKIENYYQTIQNENRSDKI